MDQPIRAKQASASALKCDMATTFASRALWSPFSVSQQLTNLSQNFSDNNQNNQSGRFPVLQEEELERQKSNNSEPEHIKTEHKHMVEYLQ